MDTALITSGFKALTATIQATKTVSRFKRFWNGLWFNRKRILVVGESGSGKSQFLSSIQKYGVCIDERTLVAEEIKMTLDDGHVIIFVDLPGHSTSREIRKRRISEISKGKYIGIVNVVCYGYQVIDEVNADKVFEAGTNNVKVGFLNDNRKLELSQIDEWVGHITLDSGIKWVLTLVNKADLWINDTNVSNYYEEGEYSSKFERIKSLADCVVIPYCSIIGNFYNRHLSLIDEKEKIKLHNNLRNNLLKLIQ